MPSGSTPSKTSTASNSAKKPAPQKRASNSSPGGPKPGTDGRGENTPWWYNRSDAFREFTRRRAAGDVVVPPLQLSEYERRLHVRATLMEDNERRISNRPDGAQSKFDTLADSLFSFFRGSALLYYRDVAGSDADLPTVFAVGDVHPENFGVMPNADGAPFFGVNDFDEAWSAPFSYDVKRGALGFWICADMNGAKAPQCRRVVESFVDGYLHALRLFASDNRSETFQFRLDSSPRMIRDLLEDSLVDRETFLRKKINLETERFEPTKKIIPHTSHIVAFQEVVDAYVANNDLGEVERPEDFFTVIDVARKKHSGTASLGLDRYWILLKGWGNPVEDRVILEMKQARRSAMLGLVPFEDLVEDDEGSTARRIATAQSVHLVGGDPLYGFATIDGESFLVRERSPYKNDVDVAELDLDELIEYASICGAATAQPHARSRAHGEPPEDNTAATILASINPALFTADVVAFSELMFDRVAADHALFSADHALGAFAYWDEPRM